MSPYRLLRVLPALALAACAACGGRGGPPGEAHRWRSAAPPVTPASAARVLEEVGKPGARVVLVNVWATWCAPCREELPDLVRLGREYRGRGLRLVLVSADFDDAAPAARKFLAKQGVDFPTFIKNGDDMEFINAMDPAWTGALPATFLYDGTGRRLRFWEGRQTYRTLERAARAVLGAADSMEVSS